MKQPNIHANQDLSKISGLIFFAQCLSELLFDHTIDSFKAPALDTMSRAFELEALADEASQGNFSNRALLAAIEELKWSIGLDPVIKGQDRIIASRLADEMSEKHNSPAKLTQLCGTLTLHLRNYWGDAKSRILFCIEDEKRKAELLALAAIVTTQIELMGFDRRHAYFLTTEIFFRRFSLPTAVEDPRALALQFLQFFDAKRRDWKVIYRVSDKFHRFAQHMPLFNMAVSDTSPIDPQGTGSTIVRAYLRSAQTLPSFLSIESVVARDPFSAKQVADRRIEAFIDACKFHDHLGNLTFNPLGVVIDVGEKPIHPILLKPTPNPLTLGRTKSLQEVAASIAVTSEILHGRHLTPESTRRFGNALEFHRAAIETPTLENQLLDLWAAVEGFLPQPDSQARISHYIDAILPPITLSYPERLFRYISQTLNKANVSVNDRIAALNGDGDFFEKTVRIITCVEHEKALKDLLGRFDANPLLRFRVYRLHEQFKSADTIHETLSMHRQKVAWHIQRIYNTRNMISHRAEAFRYLRTLIENLHGYIDALVPSVSKLAVESATRLDITSAVALLGQFEKQLLTELKRSGKKRCAESNFKALIFGFQSPLAPC